MFKTTRQTLVCASLAVASIFGLKAVAQPQTTWEMGDPIISYWAGPGAMGVKTQVTDQSIEQLRAGGWNAGWAKTPEQLDVYDRHGVRAIYWLEAPDIDDPEQAKALEALVEQIRTHPALYAYYLSDEPGTGAFPKLGKLVAWLHQHDPKHLAYINLLPTYASDGQLQVSDDAAERAKVGQPQDFAGINTDDKTTLRYRQYLRQFIATVNADLISYDHYHFLKNGDGVQYFLNLSMIRAAALEANRPFMNIIQACNSPAEGWREPGEHEVRWLTYTSLAYGAQAITHFRYDAGFWQDPMESEHPKLLYWTASQLNREFLAIALQLRPLTSLGAYHCGPSELPLGAEALPADCPFAPESTQQDVLLGTFGQPAGQPTHVVVVNLDYKTPATITLNGPGEMEIFHTPSQSWRKADGGKQIQLDLLPGGGALVRLSHP